MKQIKEKDTVMVHYTGKYDDGDIFDSSINKTPLKFKVGEGKLIPGLEDAVLGMMVNEQKTINIPSIKAYGAIRMELIQEIEKDRFPHNIPPMVGQQFISKAPDGNEFMVKVIEVGDTKIKIDANHPLAGKNITFDIQIVDIM